MSFTKLLEDLEALKKAIPTEGSVPIAKAGPGKEAGEGEGGADGEGDTNDLGKSFSFELADGTQVDAVDGTALVKALTQRVDASEAQLGEAVAVATAQNELIKSLQGQVAALSGQGRGRRAVVTITEKPGSGTAEALAKSETGDGGMTGDQFMAKAMAALDAQRITGKDISLIESSLFKKIPISESMRIKVLGA